MLSNCSDYSAFYRTYTYFKYTSTLYTLLFLALQQMLRQLKIPNRDVLWYDLLFQIFLQCTAIFGITICFLRCIYLNGCFAP